MSEFYNEYYRDMDEQFIRWREITGRIKAKNIIRISRCMRFSSVIEVGCGTGIILKTLSEKNFADKFYGSDISEPALEYVRRQEINGLIEAKRGDALNVPYGDKMFDLAILSHILEHLDDPATAIGEAKRIARQVVIEVPLEENIIRKIRVILWRLLKRNLAALPERKIGHIRFFNRRSALQLAVSCGLILERSQRIFLPPKIHFFNARTRVQKIKAAAKVVLQGITRISGIPLITVHFIMLCRSD